MDAIKTVLILLFLCLLTKTPEGVEEAPGEECSINNVTLSQTNLGTDDVETGFPIYDVKLVNNCTCKLTTLLLSCGAESKSRVTYPEDILARLPSDLSTCQYKYGLEAGASAIFLYIGKSMWPELAVTAVGCDGIII